MVEFHSNLADALWVDSTTGAHRVAVGWRASVGAEQQYYK